MSNPSDPGSNLGDVVLALLVILIVADVWYKTANPDCSPDAPWYLQATTRQCRAIAAKAAQQQRQEIAAHQEDSQSS